MHRDRNFYQITLADFIVRGAYQMGKTPLLPLFALALGATDLLLGLIVSVSTLTGMVMKPLFGFLSDRQGRRWWLLLGTAFFAFIPFLYQFVETPGQLAALRIIHGTSTAIYGPITLAYVAERGGKRKGAQLGIFGMARSGGYIVGPTIAGWMLLSMEPAAVFTAIGLISCSAFLPVIFLEEGRNEELRNEELRNEELRGSSPIPGPRSPVPSPRSPIPDPRSPIPDPQSPVPAFLASMKIGARTPGVWLSGGLEASTYIGTYAIKAFLPIYALAAGFDTLQIGLFFSVQEAVHLLAKPVGGYTGDRLGYLMATGLGIFLIAAAMPGLTVAGSLPVLLLLSGVMGFAQALIIPCTTALVSEQLPDRYLGSGLGVVGAMDNAGKVVGPLVGGALIVGFGYSGMLWALGGFMLVCGLVVLGFASGRLKGRSANSAPLESSGD